MSDHEVSQCCSGCGCDSEGTDEVDRRVFLKSAGASVALLGSSGFVNSVMAGPFERNLTDDEIQHFVPADKKLSKEWLASLSKRGKPRICTGKELDTIAMPIGGICAGQLYLCGDGSLASWQIFNKRSFSGYGRDNYKFRKPQSPVDQGFAVVVNTGGQRRAFTLNNSGFESIEFTGEYPIGVVNYKDKASPVTVQMQAFSPFVPINEEDSALPATIFHLKVSNTSNADVDVSLLSWLENAICHHNGEYLSAQKQGRIKSVNKRSYIVHEMIDAPKPERPLRKPIVLVDFEGDDYGRWKTQGQAFGNSPAQGTLKNQNNVSGFAGKGLVNTFIDGDKPQGKLVSPTFKISRSFINFLIGGGNHPGETCIKLVVDGAVLQTSTGRNSERLLWSGWDVQDLVGKDAKIEIVDANSGGWGHINIDQIVMSDEDKRGPSGPLDELEDYGTMVLACDLTLAGLDETKDAIKLLGQHSPIIKSQHLSCPAQQRSSLGMLTDTVSLKPGSSNTFTCVLSWHFPNREQGNFYATRFNSAQEVSKYVLDNHDRLSDDTISWHTTFYQDSTLPRWLLDRLHSTVGNLATGTCQWWADGRFWAWEGVGCCHGTCTHVWNYAQAAARLFPRLERSAREMQDLGVALHEDGLVGFRGDLNGAYAADGQAGTVLKCYREHLMSADDKFLKRNWPNIKKVLEYLIKQDGNSDGLIENSQHNTYDINFQGPNTFVGSLYLAALTAGDLMASRMGEYDLSNRLDEIFVRGSNKSIDLLFNGEYFVQKVDLAKHPQHQYGDGCLSDQLFGQGWTKQLGIGDLYTNEEVLSALKSVWKYNWAPDINAQNKVHKPERWFASPGEAGLFTCTWPKSKYLDKGVRYKNEVWTGIEYQVAGHMIWEGMLSEGLAICKAIHDRYHPIKRNPYNEVECGDHYARALASWGVYLALCGFNYDGPAGNIGFAPKLNPQQFKAAFTTAEGWGSFFQRQSNNSQSAHLNMKYGILRTKSVYLQVAENHDVTLVQVMLNGKQIPANWMQAEVYLYITLEKEVTVQRGQTLKIEIS